MRLKFLKFPQIDYICCNETQNIMQSVVNRSSINWSKIGPIIGSLHLDGGNCIPHFIKNVLKCCTICNFTAFFLTFIPH